MNASVTGRSRRLKFWLGLGIGLGLFVLFGTLADGDFGHQSDGPALVAGAAAIALYFLPAIIAQRRHHPSRDAITIVNAIFGLTVIGWLAALVWALSRPLPTRSLRLPCPNCSEAVLPSAHVCPHCHRDLPDGWSTFRQPIVRLSP